jgi:hypothetical protein
MAIDLDQTKQKHQQTAVTLFTSQAALVDAVRELHRLGFGNDQLSVLAKDADALAECIRLEGTNEGIAVDVVGELAYDAEPKGRPEFLGMALGGAVGVVLGMSSVVIPGFGTFLIAAGPVAIALHGLTVGAAGMGLGALLGAILDEKVTEDHRDYFAREIEAGRWMLVVHGNDHEIDRATQTLKLAGAACIDTF